MEYKILHNTIDCRFEVTVDGETALVEYVDNADNSIDITHTYVPQALEGRGIAAALTKAILDHANQEGLKVNPICPYTATYIQRHPEYQHLTIK